MEVTPDLTISNLLIANPAYSVLTLTFFTLWNNLDCGLQYRLTSSHSLT